METGRCSAGWYELNISAPDNVVSACCYYHGGKEPWLDEYKDLRAYWNSAEMQRLRLLNSGKTLGTLLSKARSGCAGCHFYENKTAGTGYYDFSREPADLDVRQRENWLAAKSDFEQGRLRVSSLPLRIYANFGFGCNLTCGACIQVPHRKNNRRQVLADTILRWREDFRSILDFSIIGGEPFALPEGLKFIRAFIDDESLAAVRLSVFTNGTVHHKHWDLLRRKEKLSLTISLDSIGTGYARLREGGNWEIVERNMVDFLDLARKDRPQWRISTNAMMTKTGIRSIPEFARWHVRHQVGTWFYDFISTPGNEDFYNVENVLRYPQQLDDMPEWRERINDAICIFDEGKRPGEAASLRHYLGRLERAVAETAERRRIFLAAPAGDRWRPLLVNTGAQDVAASVAIESAEPAGNPLSIVDAGALVFTQTRVGDSACTRFVNLKPVAAPSMVRATLRWYRRQPEIRAAHVMLQDSQGNLRETFRQTSDTDLGTQTVIVYDLTDQVRVRLVATPTGEDASALPDEIVLECCEAETWKDSAGTAISRKIKDEIRLKALPRIKARIKSSPAAMKVIRLIVM